MFLPGYDAWKTREPDECPNGTECPKCGGWMRWNRFYHQWSGLECTTPGCHYEEYEPDPTDEPDYDAWAEDGP